MSNIGIRSSTSVQPTAIDSKGSYTDARSKKPAPFVRSGNVDAGRLSDFRHHLANGTRRLFGRQEQPSAAERQQHRAFLDWRAAQLAAAAGSAQQAQQAQGHRARAVYEPIDHERTQALIEQSWHQWRLANPGVSHPVRNQPNVVATYL